MENVHAKRRGKEIEREKRNPNGAYKDKNSARKMSHKLQITVSDEVAEILKREAESRKVRFLTYVGIFLSEAVMEKEKKRQFDDGF